MVHCLKYNNNVTYELGNCANINTKLFCLNCSQTSDGTVTLLTK